MSTLSNLATPAVSVITPVYNAAATLPRMLQSVLEQSLENIEHIVIDDGSTDGSGAMLDEYQAAHPERRISVIHQSNSGVPAYNPGLDAARGEYVAFLDHDDYLAPDFCELLYRRAVAEDADICKGECIEFTDQQHKPPTRGNTAIRQLHSKLGFVHYFWTAIYKRQLLEEHHLRFSEQIILGQDTLFQNEAVLACRKLSLEDGARYFNLCGVKGTASGYKSGFAPAKVAAVIESYNRIAANLYRQRLHCDAPGLSFVFTTLIKTLLGYIAPHVHEPDDARRCVACAKELLKRCPVQAQGLVRSNLKQHYPQLAAQLRIR